MMTIKEFASLCGCSTQTLRYYDRINLLKPVQVDPWTGYRYYDKNQAVTFVKIKSFQSADFSIEEIKQMLFFSDQQVFDAFEHKIVEQTQKLERIKSIQRSYLTEKTNMEKLVQYLSDYLLNAVQDFSVLREFGLSPDRGVEVVSRLKTFIEDKCLQHLPDEPSVCMIVEDKLIRGADHVANAIAELKGSDYSETVLLGGEEISDEDGFTFKNSVIIWEKHGWNYVYEFIDDIPELKAGFDYCFSFQLTDDKYSDGLEFPMFMIATMILRANEDLVMGCCVEKSQDGQNHFALLRRK